MRVSSALSPPRPAQPRSETEWELVGGLHDLTYDGPLAGSYPADSWEYGVRLGGSGGSVVPLVLHDVGCGVVALCDGWGWAGWRADDSGTAAASFLKLGFWAPEGNSAACRWHAGVFCPQGIFEELGAADACFPLYVRRLPSCWKVAGTLEDLASVLAKCPPTSHVFAIAPLERREAFAPRTADIRDDGSAGLSLSPHEATPTWKDGRLTLVRDGWRLSDGGPWVHYVQLLPGTCTVLSKLSPDLTAVYCRSLAPAARSPIDADEDERCSLLRSALQAAEQRADALRRQLTEVERQTKRSSRTFADRAQQLDAARRQLDAAFQRELAADIAIASAAVVELQACETAARADIHTLAATGLSSTLIQFSRSCAALRPRAPLPAPPPSPGTRTALPPAVRPGAAPAHGLLQADVAWEVPMLQRSVYGAVPGGREDGAAAARWSVRKAAAPVAHPAPTQLSALPPWPAPPQPAPPQSYTIVR
eukprot:TRINITY_DN25927_c0_g1_i1.p1 TRINITY_DN25927_c0_g1~~TRINITY_DN25927_c0_g1_i1.p1  ORF type:complete len:478 (+),score=104.87 TRINITY_DN25927_c0_g1_i1:46-1479(+)